MKNKIILSVLMLINLVSCIEDDMDELDIYENNGNIAHYENIKTIGSILVPPSICTTLSEKIVIRGTYSVPVEKRTYVEDDNFFTSDCGMLVSTDQTTETYNFSTNFEDSAVVPVMETNPSTLNICEGTISLYPVTPIWLGQKGWKCSNFNISVHNENNELIGSVDADCELQLSPNGKSMNKIVLNVSDSFNSSITHTSEINCL
jgi:hypothetical protein